MNQRIVITDIHGCFYSFKSLLEEKVKLQKKDTLYLLGDYINKGPRSREVLDYLVYLQQEGYQLHILRGNHEQELLNLLDGKSDLDSLMSKGGLTLLNSFGVQHPREIPLTYIDFIRAMDYFYVLPDFYLVHAGFDFSKQNPFTPSETLLNIRDYTVDMVKTQNRPIIHGHTPTNLSQILQSLEAKSSLHYSLDAGCAYKNNQQQANLVALDLDSWQLMCQPNIDPSANYA